MPKLKSAVVYVLYYRTGAKEDAVHRGYYAQLIVRPHLHGNILMLWIPSGTSWILASSWVLANYRYYYCNNVCKERTIADNKKRGWKGR